MTDVTALAIVAALVTCIQTISTAWLNRTIRQNACGGARCADVIQRQVAGGKDRERARPSSG